MPVVALLGAGVPLDPSSYPASWGVLGALVFVIAVLGAIIFSIFVRGAAASQKRDELLMNFVNGHTEKTGVAMDELAEKIRVGDERIAVALEGQARALQAVLITWDGLQRARALKAGGKELTTAEIEQVIRAAHDAVRRGAG